MRLLVLQCGGRRLALPAQDVLRVLFYAPPQELPQLPPWSPGFLTLAGQLVPVIDLARLLHWPSTPPDLHTHTVLVACEEQHVLLLVGRVEQLLDVPAADLRPLPPDRTLQGLMAAAWWDRGEAVPIVVPRLLLMREEKERLQHFQQVLQGRGAS